MVVKHRIEWIDIAKGIGIIAMIIGHIDFGTGVRYFIHAWNMPIFFILSGYLYNENNGGFRYRILKKTQSLLIPYFMFALIYFVIWLIKYRPDIEAIEQTFISIFWINTNNNLPIANALWFLTCMFFATLIFDGIHRICGRKAIKEVLYISIIVCVGIFAPTYTRIVLPWALFQSFVATGFIYIGLLLKKYNIIERICSLKTLWFYVFIIAFGIISGWMIMLHHEVNMRTNSYGCFLMFIVNATIFPVLIAAVSERLTKSKIPIIKILITEIKFVGKNSIVYLCLNQITIFAIGMVLIATNTPPFNLICLFMCMLLIHIFSLIIIRKPFDILIGKIPTIKEK